MHSADPHKLSGKLREDFLAEFELILTEAGDLIADFTYFMFPRLDLGLRVTSASCNFFDATFVDEASFDGTVFHHNVYFERACFRKSVNFHQASFTHDSDFYFTDFFEEVSFVECNFQRNVYFSSCMFRGGVDFHGSKFMRGARFRLTKFFSEELAEKTPLKPSPIFSLVSFTQPQNVLFYKTDLSRALFTNCDVSRIGLSRVVWLRRRNNGKRMLFEENLPLESPYAEPLRLRSLESEDLEGRELTRELVLETKLTSEPFYRDYGLVADSYQQLRKNYDYHGDYWKAGDFHYGEMEMQRLSIRSGKDWLSFRKWWHPRLSFVAWYKYTSAYGESFARPLALMALTILCFSLLYPFLGLQHNDLTSTATKQVLTYASAWPSQSSGHDRFWAEAKVFIRGFITTLDTATFQRTTEYAPLYPWGRFLAIFETLLTSTLFALFLLALRRQFRR